MVSCVACTACVARANPLSRFDVMWFNWSFGVNFSFKFLCSLGKWWLNDNPIFNLSHRGNIGFSTNILSTTNVIPTNLLNNYMNVVNIDDANVIVSMPGSIQNGQLVDITIGQVNIINRQLELDISSNILNAFGCIIRNIIR